MSLDLALRHGYERAAFTTHETEPEDPCPASLFPHLADWLRRRGKSARISLSEHSDRVARSVLLRLGTPPSNAAGQKGEQRA
jgi:predicted ATPase